MEVQAFAKLNLTLEVLGRRQDGYHQVRTILQTIDLADVLDISPASSLRVECHDRSLQGEANLVWKAAQALAQSADHPPGAHIYIQKRIPVGMGLGGGSSDAAAALLVLNQLWGLGLSIQELAVVAATLGSDVAFFLTGGTALGEGRGEIIEPLKPLPSLPVTLICPGYTIPNKTSTMYSMLTPAHYSDGGVTRRMIQELVGGAFAPDLMYNVFEAVAWRAFPELSWLYQRSGGPTSDRLHLCGAGPAWFILPSSEDEFRRLSDALQPYAVGVYLVNTLTPGAMPGAGC
ncbi:MAG: 4-(cytidine 5'-diphospho)-2-C-methyl-D-erythritol kinase [SAR202 cluster bacterium Io17-Chloro-G9]|nr:MAG: 4-(cytidine 5'-diphospho)-2-C-methyl-D-erythritol kinase [SAR202 cluster bacterium Io17-Chloro-G9]